MSEVANAQVAVFPVFKGFRSTVDREVSGAAKAAGGSFTKAFKGAAELQVDTTRLTRAVGQAGGALAKARQAQATAAGRVRVAEAQLAESIEKTGRNSARTVAAEEKLAAAQRGLETSTERTEAAVKDLAQAQDRLKRSSEQAGAAGSAAAKKYSGGWASIKDRMARATSGGMKKAGAIAGTAFKAGVAGGVLAVGATVLAATDKAVDILKESIDEATESFKVTRITENALKQTGAAAWISAGQIGAMSEALSEKIGVDDEAIQSGANLLLTFKNVRNEAGKGGDIFNRATAAAQDLAAAGFGSAESSAKMLGKALNDPMKGMTALGRAGVTFTDAQKKRVAQYVKEGNLLKAQKIIMGEVESQVGGAAAASSTAAEKLSVKWGNLQERMGTALLPAVNKVADALGPVLTRAVDGAMPMIEGLGNGFQGLTDWLAQNPAVMEGFTAGLSLAGDAADGLATTLGPVLGLALQGALAGFSSLVRGVNLVVGAFASIPLPQFDWAREAVPKLEKVADGADALREGLADLGKVHPEPTVTLNDKATAAVTKVDDLIRSLKDKIVTAKAKGDDKGLKDLERKLREAEKRKHVLEATIRGRVDPSADVIRLNVSRGGKTGVLRLYRDGGLIGGVGTGTSDSNLIAASRGEYMIRQRAVERIGQRALDRINATGQLPVVPVGGGGGAPVIVQGNVYGDHYLAQINRRDATRRRQSMQREGILT